MADAQAQDGGPQAGCDCDGRTAGDAAAGGGRAAAPGRHDHHHPAHHHERLSWAAFAVIVTFMLVEIAGGIYARSLALIADAGHMASDALALLLAAFAFRLARRPRDEARSYGYARAEVLAAFVNGLGLLVLVVWIVIEAVARILDPPVVKAGPMLAVAAAGLVANVVALLLLHRGDHDNLNIRAAIWHVIGDILGSVAAIAAALVILSTGWTPIDPILSLAIALLLLWAAWGVLRPSVHILMEGTPEEIDPAELERHLLAHVPQLAGIHHVHVWSLSRRERLLTAHLEVADMAHGPEVMRRTKEELASRYGIHHSTLQLEERDCADRPAPPGGEASGGDAGQPRRQRASRRHTGSRSSSSTVRQSG